MQNPLFIAILLIVWGRLLFQTTRMNCPTKHKNFLSYPVDLNSSQLHIPFPPWANHCMQINHQSSIHGCLFDFACNGYRWVQYFGFNDDLQDILRKNSVAIRYCHDILGYLIQDIWVMKLSWGNPVQWILFWMSLRAAELAGHDQRNVTGQPLEINVEKVGEHVDLYRLLIVLMLALVKHHQYIYIIIYVCM